MRTTVFFNLLLMVAGLIGHAQPNLSPMAKAHSHNDYEQPLPFSHAYQQLFGSIEADIWLQEGKILVGHDKKDLNSQKTLQALYLDPLREAFRKNGNQVYPTAGNTLQLLIDIKSEALSTLQALKEVLHGYPELIGNSNFRISISGNRPAPEKMVDYPSYIYFDGRPYETYSPEALKKIGLISDKYFGYTKNGGAGLGRTPDLDKIRKVIQQAHSMGKPFRFWGTPDNTETWELMLREKADFINTDKIDSLAAFLKNASLSSYGSSQTLKEEGMELMPYNRLARSAGQVIRFGDPSLENHALEITSLPNSSISFVLDRYGVVVLDVKKTVIKQRYTYQQDPAFKKMMSVYNGIKTFQTAEGNWVAWTASESDGSQSGMFISKWEDSLLPPKFISIRPTGPYKKALPNDFVIQQETTNSHAYVVLNGSNQVVKLDLATGKTIWSATVGNAPYGICAAAGKLYVTNWAGPLASDSSRERAGTPAALAYTDPQTGATAEGSLVQLDPATGTVTGELMLGLHPNAITSNRSGSRIYICNSSSDYISVIDTRKFKELEQIPVSIFGNTSNLQGSTPNGLCLSTDEKTLYVANGHDNALAVVRLSEKTGKPSQVSGFIPTEAFPSGISINGNQLVVANLEAQGAHIMVASKKAASIHQQKASVSIINIPESKAALDSCTKLALVNSQAEQAIRTGWPARPGIQPVPVPERMGEPSVFKHVVYIIKENKTYDQVFGDLPQGRGDSSLTVYGFNTTPNMHALANRFGLMDNFYASGKSSAEGHQWTDAAMVSDYVEKNVRAWFRSYPHRQEDALVYNKAGFIWNQALDHGKTVRVYGEACTTPVTKGKKWLDYYKDYQAGKQPDWKNTSTIARLLPIIHPTYPDCDNLLWSDQQRADLFIEEWKSFEASGQLPNLLILSLPNDHSAGTSPDFPTPAAMVADNDLALGRILETVTQSPFWDSTVVFVTEDDSQGGWDHLSPYRTVGLVVSPYNRGGTITTRYNQTCMVRTIEQILGLPPMNFIDATALPMYDCFGNEKTAIRYKALANNIPLDQMNKPMARLRGVERALARQSKKEVFEEVDGGEDEKMNRILWYHFRGKEAYPGETVQQQ